MYSNINYKISISPGTSIIQGTGVSQGVSGPLRGQPRHLKACLVLWGSRINIYSHLQPDGVAVKPDDDDDDACGEHSF